MSLERRPCLRLFCLDSVQQCSSPGTSSESRIINVIVMTRDPDGDGYHGDAAT